MKNNIFDFATSELSQDAFICWCANCFNDDSRPELKEMATRLLQTLSKTKNIEQVKIFRQFSQTVTVEEEKIALKIDVLLLVNGRIAVIIEDKTYSGEHDDQIARYKRGLQYLAANSEKYKEFAGVEVRTVYFKTGFLYDDDKLVKPKVDLVFTGEDFVKLLSPYEGSSEILDSYIAYLKWLQGWYETHGRYQEIDEDSGTWNLSKHHFAQYCLMRDIFPESKWKDRNSWTYRVYHRSNRGGSPWTQMRICDTVYYGTSDKYFVCWRIDTDRNGPYISLRFYEDFEKNDEAKRARHRSMYTRMSKAVREIVEHHPDLFYFTWGKEVDPGFCGNYKESSLIHLKLDNKLKNWNSEGDSVIQAVRELTQLFCNEMLKINM